MNTELKNKLEQEARYLHIAIPYDKNDELITFDDGVMTELECDEEFVPPMLNAEDQLLESLIDLKHYGPIVSGLCSGMRTILGTNWMT